MYLLLLEVQLQKKVTGLGKWQYSIMGMNLFVVEHWLNPIMLFLLPIVLKPEVWIQVNTVWFWGSITEVTKKAQNNTLTWRELLFIENILIMVMTSPSWSWTVRQLYRSLSLLHVCLMKETPLHLELNATFQVYDTFNFIFTKFSDDWFMNGYDWRFFIMVQFSSHMQNFVKTLSRSWQNELFEIWPWQRVCSPRHFRAFIFRYFQLF